MSFELHEYQKKCLEDLTKFFNKAADGNPRSAFFDITDHDHGKYHAPPKMDGVPYVCIRVPTGGGKTLMASHAIGIAAKHYSQTESPVCLWIAPSSAIVNQTLRALQDHKHPCRMALMDAFQGRSINCISISDALRISRADLDSGATVIVATIQSFRQDRTDGRKIYDENGNLMEHFQSIPDELKDNLRHEGGVIYQSLDNALNLRRPIIISDEAHNSGTSLSYESLTRFNPSCIVEFTATPKLKHKPDKGEYASNVLTQASAFQLKNAGMIKFPLNLEVKNDPRESIRAAIAKRNELEKLAAREGAYIRPVVLYQAEDKSGEITVAEIERMLVEEKEFAIPKEQIAVQSGTRKELEKHDLQSPDCPVRHVITVRALAEGWDCPFAYVLCSMANYQNPRPVEQVLGRILRLPYASLKKEKMLNECYAYVARGRFHEVAKSLKDALINKNGMQTIEAHEFIETPITGGLFGDPQPKSTIDIKQFKVPMLMVGEKGNQQQLDYEHFLDAKWSIAKEKPNVSGFSFPQTTTGKAVIDVNKKGEITAEHEYTYGDVVRQQSLMLEADKAWTLESLAAWLDESIKHLDIPQTQFSPYVYAAVKELQEKHELAELARYRFYLRNFLEKSIEGLRNAAAKRGYQLMLETMEAPIGKLEVSAKNSLTLERGRYQPHWECKNAPFRKHLHPVVGELRDEGEEWECAVFLDNMPEVKAWVRNLERRDYSFWLQTSTDKFYPDFVCQLNDKRILVVEYKGGDRWSNDDSKEKRAIGEIWAKLSGGKCLFIMPKGKDLNAIREVVEND